jgi:hypothetical protein
MSSYNSNEIGDQLTMAFQGIMKESHDDVASGKGRDCRRFFINTRVKASSMIHQP